MEAVRQRHRRDPPNLLPPQDLIDRRATRHPGQHGLSRHQERGGKSISFRLGHLANRFPLLAMKHQVPQLVSGVEATSFGRLSRAEEYERHAITPERKGIYLCMLRCQGEDSNAVS